MNKTILKALSFGLVIGIIDSILVANLDPDWHYLDIITIITFWTILSLVIKTSSFGGEVGIKKGIIWSIILNVPWATHFAAIGMTEILPLFVIVTFLYGAIIGWLNSKFNCYQEGDMASEEMAG